VPAFLTFYEPQNWDRKNQYAKPGQTDMVLIFGLFNHKNVNKRKANAALLY